MKTVLLNFRCFIFFTHINVSFILLTSLMYKTPDTKEFIPKVTKTIKVVIV